MTKHRVERRKPNRKTKKSVSIPRTQKLSHRHMTKKHETVSREGTRRKTLEEYKITFYYHYPTGKKRQETLTVLARDMDDAVNHAMKQRKIKRKPTKTVIKDGIGDVLLKIAKGAGQVVGTVTAIKREYESGRIERLVKSAQSNNKAISIPARSELRRRYPHIYRQIAFEEV